MEKITFDVKNFGGLEEIQKISLQHGTPCYIYSQSLLEKNFQAYAQHSSNELICVAIKANSNPVLLNLLGEKGAGADVVSGGELRRALDAGIDAQKIVFSGVGKTAKEIAYAIDQQIYSINVESEQELEQIAKIANEKKQTARVSFRLNPNVDAKTHPKIATGMYENKFGIDEESVFAMYEKSSKQKYVEPVGIHFHLGSQIFSRSPYEKALSEAFKLIEKINAQGFTIEFLNVGGGVGLREASDDEHIQAIEEHMQSIRNALQGKNIRLLLEPGRSIFGNAGLLLSKVLYTKKNQKKEFVIIDAGMNDYMRPALYEAKVNAFVLGKENSPKRTIDLVGPVCESTDTFGKDMELSECEPGDLIALSHVGAYGYSMSSQYNLRPRPSEHMWDGERFVILREPTIET